MDNIIAGLITDRTSADVERAKYLKSLWNSVTGEWSGTAAEYAEWEAGVKGAYNAKDTNRVLEAISYLAGRLERFGYTIGDGDVVPAYSIQTTINPLSSGVVSGAGTYYEGDEATLIAMPSSKYNFAKWTENNQTVSESAAYTFTVDKSRTLAAVFVLKTFSVTVGIDPPDSGEVTGAGTYDIDTLVTIAAEAGDGYVFGEWQQDGVTVGEGESYSFTLTEDTGLTAVFIKTYIITVGMDKNGGTVSGGGTYREGEEITVTASASDGYVFTGWTENGTVISTSENYTFTVNADRNLVAAFVNLYTVSTSVTPESYGTVTGAGAYQDGAQCTVTALPGEGNRFVAWTESGSQVSAEASYTFDVDGNRALVAVFEEIPVYTIIVDVDPAGAGTVSGGGLYQEDDTVTVTATAKED